MMICAKSRYTAFRSFTVRLLNVQGAETLPTPGATLEEPQCTAHGTSLLSINAPASVPVYIRRRALVGLHGINCQEITNSLDFSQWLIRLYRGLFPFAYHKLISTRPFTALVSSSIDRSFAAIHLDGSSDWALLNRHCLQAYSGASLSLSMPAYPSKISRALARQIQVPVNTSTGLSKWYARGYTFLSGRGIAGITGRGSIYTIHVEKELSICRDNLVAVSVAGPLDLMNCVVGQEFGTTVDANVEKTKSLRETIELVRQVLNERKQLMQKVNLVLKICWHYCKLHYRSARRAATEYFIGRQKFVRVIGPRTILLQSHGVERRPSFKQAESEPTSTPTDYLNYVTIERGKGAVFESTPDFQSTIQRNRS